MPKVRTAIIVFAAVAMAIVPIFSVLMHSVEAVTTVAPTMRPNGDGALSGWIGGGTSDSTCSGQYCSRIDEDTASANTTDYLEAIGDASFTMNIGNFPVADMQKATQITVRAYAAQSARGCITNFLGCLNYNDDDEIVLDANIGSGWLGGQTNTGLNPGGTGNNANYGWLERTFTGNWTRSQIDAMTVYVGKWHADAKQDTLRVSTIEIVVTYQKAPTMNQAVYRLYRDSATTTPGAPYAATTTTSDIPLGTPFRLRTGVVVGGDEWITGSLWEPHGNTYNLQYAVKPNGGTCGTFANITTTTPIRWHDAALASGGAITAFGTAEDNIQGITPSYQTYQEGNGFTNASQVNVGETALWDFSLVGASNAPAGQYCFRIVRSDGTTTGMTHTAYAEVSETGELGTYFLDSGGSVITAPALPFANSTTATNQCTTASATLGTTSQRLQVVNDLVTAGWNMSIAATNGPTTMWESGVYRYDFNDPTSSGCGDGGDGDAYAGQLRVNTGSFSVAPTPSSCGSTGLGSGGDSKFSEGTTDAITLTYGTASSIRFCRWDIGNILLEQRIPAQTRPGSYSIDMTITTTAQ